MREMLTGTEYCHNNQASNPKADPQNASKLVNKCMESLILLRRNRSELLEATMTLGVAESSRHMHDQIQRRLSGLQLYHACCMHIKTCNPIVKTHRLNKTMVPSKARPDQSYVCQDSTLDCEQHRQMHHIFALLCAISCCNCLVCSCKLDRDGSKPF